MRPGYVALVFWIFAALALGDEAKEKPFLVLDAGGHTAPIDQLLFTPDGQKPGLIFRKETLHYSISSDMEPNSAS